MVGSSLRALRRYNGPAVPGNQDPQTNQIVHSHPFSLTSRSSAIDFTEKVLGGMAAYDRRKRLTLGEAVDHNNTASIVVALTSQLPKRILISIHQPVPRAHLNTVDPIPLAALPPFGVYYCHTTTFERILREGIRPGVHSSRATDPRHIAIKLQASGEDTMTIEKSSPHLWINGDSPSQSSSPFPPLPVPDHNGFGLTLQITLSVLPLSHWNPLTSTAPFHSTTIGWSTTGFQLQQIRVPVDALSGPQPRYPPTLQPKPRWIPTLMSDCSFSCNPETPPHQLLPRMTFQMLRLPQRKKNQMSLRLRH